MLPMPSPPPVVLEQTTPFWVWLIVLIGSLLLLLLLGLINFASYKLFRRWQEKKEVKKERDELMRRSKDEGFCSFSFMKADFIRDLSWTEDDGWTAGPEWTAGPKWSGKTFPRMQEIKKWCPEAIEEITIWRRKAFHGDYRKEICAVSHRWDESSEPDSTGTHLKKIREFLVNDLEGREVKWIWYDFWCLPQRKRKECGPGTELTGKLTLTLDGFGVKNGGERTAREKMRFDHQLKHANLLYLGCYVLVLLDLAYQARFWTQFELWLSVQEGTDKGLKPATEVHTLKRVHLEPIHNATREHVVAAENAWRTKTPEDAYNMLKGTDVQVTNQSDKDLHLPKIRSLNDDVARETLIERASNAEETEAAATKTAGQQDSRFAAVAHAAAAVAHATAALVRFRWAMPHLAMRHRADAEQYKQALEDASRHRADSEAGKVALTWVRQTNAHIGLSTAFRVGKWASRAKSRAATAPAPVASASRPEPSASKYAVAPGEKEGENIVKDLT